MAEFRQWREADRSYLKNVVPLDTPYNEILGRMEIGGKA